MIKHNGGLVPSPCLFLDAFKTAGQPIESRPSRNPSKLTSPTAGQETVGRGSNTAVAAEKDCESASILIPRYIWLANKPPRSRPDTHPSHAPRASRFARFPVRDLAAGRVCRRGA